MALARRRHRQTLTATCTTCIQNFATTLGGHSLSETVSRPTTPLAGLICAFHDLYYLLPSISTFFRLLKSNARLYAALALKVNVRDILKRAFLDEGSSHNVKQIQCVTGIGASRCTKCRPIHIPQPRSGIAILSNRCPISAQKRSMSAAANTTVAVLING